MNGQTICRIEDQQLSEVVNPGPFDSICRIVCLSGATMREADTCEVGRLAGPCAFQQNASARLLLLVGRQAGEGLEIQAWEGGATEAMQVINALQDRRSPGLVRVSEDRRDQRADSLPLVGITAAGFRARFEKTINKPAVEHAGWQLAARALIHALPAVRAPDVASDRVRSVHVFRALNGVHGEEVAPKLRGAQEFAFVGKVTGDLLCQF